MYPGPAARAAGRLRVPPERRAHVLHDARAGRRLRGVRRGAARATASTSNSSTGPQVRRLVPPIRDDVLGASYSPDDAQIVTQTVVEAFARGARAHGATIREGVTVDRLVVDGDRVVGVDTDDGRVRRRRGRGRDRRLDARPCSTARRSTSRSAASDSRWCARRRSPSGSNRSCSGPRRLASTPCSATCRAGTRRLRARGRDPDGTILLPLLVQRASGELVIGCATDYPADLDPDPTLAGLAQVAGWFATDFPSLRRRPGDPRPGPACCPFTSDQAPVIDEVMPGLFVGAGHVFGNTAGPVTGRVLSQLIAGRDAGLRHQRSAGTDGRSTRSSSARRPIGEARPMSRILVLGGAGEMGSAAVADLVARTDHEVTVGDVRPDAAGGPARAARRAADGS